MHVADTYSNANKHCLPLHNLSTTGPAHSLTSAMCKYMMRFDSGMKSTILTHIRQKPRCATASLAAFEPRHRHHTPPPTVTYAGAGFCHSNQLASRASLAFGTLCHYYRVFWNLSALAYSSLQNQRCNRHHQRSSHGWPACVLTLYLVHVVSAGRARVRIAERSPVPAR
jgi:hypothetical protein